MSWSSDFLKRFTGYTCLTLLLIIVQAWSCSSALEAQVNPVQILTLPLAEAAALAGQPRMLAAQLRARASAQRIKETRSGLFPVAVFNVTGVRVADVGTSLAAGYLTTSAVSDRFAYGGSLSQLVTDFGRTRALVGASRSTADAQENFATLTRAQVRLNVREAFYDVLGAESVLQAARAAQANRQLIVKQLSALAQSELRSTLDVTFAEVLASEADLAVVQAESAVAQQRSRLSTSMGSNTQVTASLREPSAADPLPLDPASLVSVAQVQRADLTAAEAQQEAASQVASAEKKLKYPTLGVLGSAGQLPFHDRTLQGNYAAAGFNLNVPIFNGGLFRARQTEAELEAGAKSKDVQELHLEVTEQVRNSWSRANEAFRSLDVTARLVAQSKEALRLAQARYDAGLGSIVELNQAQLNETSAEISAADANYTYLARRAELDFAAGLLN